MLKVKPNSEANDFWLDCIKSPLISLHNNKSAKNIFFNPLTNYIQRSKRNKKQSKNSKKYSYQNSKIIEEALRSEESPKKDYKKIKRSIEYTNSLYNRGMAWKKKINKSRIENNKEKFDFDKKEKEPDININKYKNLIIQKKIKKNYGNSTIYERGIKFQQKKIEKIAKLFEENNKKNNIVYPFHPDISFKNLNHVFFSDNYCKEQADNDSNKIFISRLNKARRENDAKKNYFENYLKKIYKWDCPKKLKTSLSQKDSLIYKKELHNSLLDLKCLPTNESNNDKIEEYFLS